MFRHYIISDDDLEDFYPNDYVEDIDDDVLINELISRGKENIVRLSSQSPTLIEQFQNASRYQLHDIMADIVGLQHTASKEEILNKLSDMI